jgi:hypothetical protein
VVYIRCKKCGDVIVSKHRHDYRTCKCGKIAIDGGSDYTKITGNREDWEYDFGGYDNNESNQETKT